MRYTWEEMDVSPGVTVRERVGGTGHRYGEVETVIAVGSEDGGMYKFGLFKPNGNFCSKPMYKTELLKFLNEKFYEPVSK